MGEVIGLRPRDQSKTIWVCDCGCSTHHVRGDDEIECAHCGNLASLEGCGDWRVKLPPLPDAPQEVPDEMTNIVDLGSSGASLARTLGKADADRTALVIVVQDDGAVSVWGNELCTEDQRAWLDRRLETAKEMLTE